ncbi:uncharacterized protein RAG0_07380 [Rhynchosporium agropyri]|uniref:Uncharacterized protein n=1 Tax=Rhynchosporium agropyri TaxID=914238 RepID=A0A1E1KLC6_9HELO|nr:uncharacterized protein RAG0_07380 [Rhynchosporium agropyri]
MITQDLLRAGPSQAPGSRDLASRSRYGLKVIDYNDTIIIKISTTTAAATTSTAAALVA